MFPAPLKTVITREILIIENKLKKQVTMLVHCNAQKQITRNSYLLPTLMTRLHFLVFGIVLNNACQMQTYRVRRKGSAGPA